ncbi:MAG TPA: SMP-30/gluconolactonase/LRE family protein, partial [Polyangia bacterium]
MAAACATSPAEPPASTVGGPAPLMLAGAGTPRALPTPVPFVSLEGPFWVADGPYLIFSDVVEKNGPGAVIYRFDPTMRRFSIFPYAVSDRGPTSTNGLAVDAAGGLIATERYNGRLVRISPEGERTVLADAWPPSRPGHPGTPLNAPNDVVVRADGN